MAEAEQNFLQITIPIILSNKIHALENSRGPNCQFDISSCVRTLISFFQKIRVFNSRDRECLVFSGI